MVSGNIPVYFAIELPSQHPSCRIFWGVSLVEILLEEESTIIILPNPSPTSTKNMKCNKCTTDESYDITYNMYIYVYT